MIGGDIDERRDTTAQIVLETVEPVVFLTKILSELKLQEHPAVVLSEQAPAGQLRELQAKNKNNFTCTS